MLATKIREESDLILLNAETDRKEPIERRPRNQPDFYWIQSTKIGWKIGVPRLLLRDR